MNDCLVTYIEKDVFKTIKRAFGLGWISRLRFALRFLFFFFLFFFFFWFQPHYLTESTVNNARMHCSWVPQIPLFSHFFIKNGSHGTIHTFKNYFATVFSVSAKISSIQTNTKCKEIMQRFQNMKNRWEQLSKIS